MAEKVVCRRCGKSLASEKVLASLTRIIQGKGVSFDTGGVLTLCPACKRKTFVGRMIGGDLEKINPPGYVPPRRTEKLKPRKTDKKTGATVLKSSCWTCNNGCDALVYVKDGKVIKVEGDASSPTTRGVLCAKGLASTSLLYHPDRLKDPLKRLGPRGAGDWGPISWEEALDTIALRLKETEEVYGKDSVILATGTSRGWVQYFNRFANAYHRQMMGPGYAQCLWPRFTSQLLLGIAPALECPDLFLQPGKTKCMLVWGTNPPNTAPIKASWMMDARALGAKLIVVDPLFSETASKADLWLQLRPGSDVALALGMLHVIIEEGLYDHGFVESWCLGFEELKGRVREYPPSKVAGITWVPAETIVEAARCYARTKPASLIQCLSTEQIPDTLSACLSLGILASITGNIDVPGGNVLPMPREVVPDVSLKHLLTPEDHEDRLGGKEYPLLAGEDAWVATAHSPTVWRAMLTEKPYPVKALYCQGSNPALSYANSRVVLEALKGLDFIAVADFFMTPTAELADIVLPAATWMERSSVQTYYQVTYDDIHLQQKAVEIDGCRSDYWILNELAKRLGFGHLMIESEDALSDLILKPLGLTFEQFKEMGRYTVPYTYRKYEKTGFGLPPFRNLHQSTKVELVPRKLRDLGFDPLPKHKEPLESPISAPDLAKEYPLILTTGRKEAVYRHSELRNIPVLREIVPQCLLYMHPETAGILGVREGEPVIVESPRGSVEAVAFLTLGIDPRVVLLPAQWAGRNNANNLLHDEDTAPAIGSAQLRCQLCRVRRIP
ncbi:MAG: molybdopterin-dependent oxidoreductase [Deltaproteobacteria bacterium]|nr:molybdopterin-dependent oxidoreductase [Deltaproteobacteria bacterium]